jgi:hypothetical protein
LLSSPSSIVIRNSRPSLESSARRETESQFTQQYSIRAQRQWIVGFRGTYLEAIPFYYAYHYCGCSLIPFLPWVFKVLCGSFLVLRSVDDGSFRWI